MPSTQPAPEHLLTPSPRRGDPGEERQRWRSNVKLVFAFASALVLAIAVGAYRSVFALGKQIESEIQNPNSKVKNNGSRGIAASYKNLVEILQQKCLACHSGTAKMGGLVMDTYETLMKGGTHGADIIPGKSSESRLMLMLEGKVQPRMPFAGTPLSETEMAAIRGWIDSGARGPVPGEVLAPAPKITIPNIEPQVPVVSPVGSLKFSPDGKLLAVGGYKEVRLMDVATGKVVAKLSGHADLLRSVVFSPDGKWLAAAGGDPQRSGEIKIWDLQTRQELRSIHGHADCIYSVAVSPDGKLLASGSYDKLVKVWDVQTGQELRTLKDHIDAVFVVAFSPDGNWLASGSQDRTVKIWNVASGARLYTLSDPLDAITSVAFSPSGKQLAAAGFDKLIYVWDLTGEGGKLARSLIADEDALLQLVWSPDAKTLISSSADGSIRIRDAATLSPIRVFGSQPDWVEALSISPDSKWLAAGRYNGTVSLYNIINYTEVLGPILAFEPYQPPNPAAPQAARASSGQASQQASEVHP